MLSESDEQMKMQAKMCGTCIVCNDDGKPDTHFLNLEPGSVNFTMGSGYAVPSANH